MFSLLYLIINKTPVQSEKKKGKYGIEYSVSSAFGGPCPRGWGPSLKMEFPHFRFSTLTTETDDLPVCSAVAPPSVQVVELLHEGRIED